MITSETKRQSYDEVCETLGKRQIMVLDALRQAGDCTAGELAAQMYELKLTWSKDRNNAHPRLNELVELGVVAVVGKRKCDISSKTCAVYRAVSPKPEQ